MGIRIRAGTSIGLVLGAACPALAQQDPATAVRVEKIEVTGSNIKRIEGESALPVTVITREEIRKSGVTTAAELLERIPAISGGGHNVSLGVGDSGTPGLSAVSLRGLGTTNTLVLLNGRRLSNYAFNSGRAGGGTVNLNQIPLGAVERVEVLKDGASAIYGTDAIGGVINFILRKDYEGAEVSAFGTHTDRGGGNTRKYAGAIGFGDIERDRFNVLASLDYQRDTPLKASERAFASTAIRPDLGFAATSINTFPANFLFDGVTYNVTAARGCMPSAGAYRVNLQTGAPAPLQTFCAYDYASVLDILPPSERKGLFARGVLQIGRDHQAFAEYHFSRNEFTFASSETPVMDFLGDGSIRYPVGGPYYPTSVALPDGTVVRPTGNLEISWRLKQAGLRTNRAESDESRLVAGFQGAVLGWDYNTAFSRSISKASDNYIDGYVRTSAIGQAIATGLIDVFSGNPQTPAGQALIDSAKILQRVRDAEARVTSFDGKISQELAQTRNGPLAIAVGFDRRREELDDRPAEVLFSGDILGGGGPLPPTTSAERTVTAFFAELGIPILKDLEAQLAARYDRYSDFGGTFNPKVALRWTPTKDVLLRGSFGTGFRAPTISDLFLPPTASFTDFVNDPARCPGFIPLGDFVDAASECDGFFNAVVGGNAALQPEKSRQWSFGAIFEPVPGASFGIDYWSISRRNTIGTLSPDTIFNVYAVVDPANAFGRFIRRARLPGGGCVGDLAAPTPADVPCAIDYVLNVQENLGKYNVSGADLSATFRASAKNLGAITFRLEGTYFLRYRYQTLADGPYADNAGLASFDNGAIPRWRHHATINWRSGAWSATLAQNFVLGYRDEDNQDTPRRVGSWETWDLQGTWEGWRGLAVTLGVRNVFDRDPPASRQLQTFQIGYDPRYADPRGRTFYLALQYAFK